MRAGLAALALFTVGCGPSPEPLALPDDPAAFGVPVGVTTRSHGGMTFDVWYPAPDSVAGQATDEVSLDPFVPQSFADAVGPFDAPTLALGGVRDAPLRVPETTYPVVIFSHGFAGFRYQSVDHVSHLASRGYVVIAADHTGRTMADVLPCVFEPALEGCDLGGFLVDPAPLQVETLLEWLATANDDPLFEDALDTTTVGISGHSAGGGTAARMAEDARIGAMFMMAGGGPVAGSKSAFVLGGSCDAIVTEDRLAEIPEANPAVSWVQIRRAGHLAFSDLCSLDLGGFATTLLGDRDDVSAMFYDQLQALGTDGCPGGEPAMPPADCADAPYLDLETSTPMVRHFAAAFFDEALLGRGPGTEPSPFAEAEKR